MGVSSGKSVGMGTLSFFELGGNQIVNSKFIIRAIISIVWLWAPMALSQVNTEAPISPSRQWALLIYQRIAGVRIPIDHHDLTFMEAQLDNNHLDKAVERAMQSPNFYRITVKNFALKMSNQGGSIRVPFNDMAATIIGIVRDNINAKEMLTGNFYYRGHKNLQNIPGDTVEHILMSNKHYAALEIQDNQGRLDTLGGLASVLIKIEGQVVKKENNAVPNPSASGVITSRAYMEATATMGTNRAVIADTLEKFTCRSIDEASDTGSPDIFIGKDVERTPGGDPNAFLNKCSGCHSILDAFKPATAYIDFEDGYLKHGRVLQASNKVDSKDVDLINAKVNGIPIKLTRNAEKAPGGYEIKNNRWRNHAIGTANANYFQWRSPASGRGLNEYTHLLANSKAFSKCMVRRIYQSVCKRDISKFETDWVKQMSSRFESHDYNLKWLFGQIVTEPSCIGKK